MIGYIDYNTKPLHLTTKCLPEKLTKKRVKI